MTWVGFEARTEEMKMRIKFKLGRLKLRDQSEELDIDGRII
jgi:hypothetical protein